MLIQVGADETKAHIVQRLPVVLDRLERSLRALLEKPG